MTPRTLAPNCNIDITAAGSRYVCASDGDYDENLRDSIARISRFFNECYRDKDSFRPTKPHNVIAVAMNDNAEFWIPQNVEDIEQVYAIRKICDDDYNGHIYSPWYETMDIITNNEILAFGKVKKEHSIKRPKFNKLVPSPSKTRVKHEASYIWFYDTTISDGLEPILSIYKNPNDDQWHVNYVEVTNAEIEPLLTLLSKTGLFSITLDYDVNLLIQRCRYRGRRV